jgi:phage-related protein (TIGR01555 family)
MDTEKKELSDIAKRFVESKTTERIADKLSQNKEKIQNALRTTDLQVPYNNKKYNATDIMYSLVNDMQSRGSAAKDTNYFMSQTRSSLFTYYGRTSITQNLMQNGLIKNIIENPVHEAFTDDFLIKTKQLNEKEVKQLHKFYTERVHAYFKEAVILSRAYGQSGIILFDGQPLDKPFELNKAYERDIDFIADNIWMMMTNKPEYIPHTLLDYFPIPKAQYDAQHTFTYLGVPISSQRVLTFVNKRPQDIYKTAFMGRGISEFESLIEPLNKYANFTNLLYDLVSEAKISVWKIDKLRENLLQDNTMGTAVVKSMLSAIEALKNSTNAVCLDGQDDFTQAQLDFGKILEVWQFVKEQFAAESNTIVSKVFGVGASGFSNGEDDIKRWNISLENLRQNFKKHQLELMKIICMNLFDFIPDDIEIEYKPFKLLTDTQEHEQKIQQGTLIISLATTITPEGLSIISIDEAREALNASKILPIELSKRKIDKNLLTTGLPLLNQEIKEPKIVKETSDKEKTKNKVKINNIFKKIRKSK